MNGLAGGECGVLGTTWCAKGNEITAQNTRQYFAYCAQRKGQEKITFIYNKNH